MTVIMGVICKKFMIFEVFCEYLIKFFYFFSWNFFGSNILSSCCDNIKILSMGALIILEDTLKVPILAVFWRFLTFFELSILGKPLVLNTVMLWTISSMYVLLRVVRDFLVILSSEPIIDAKQTRFSYNLPSGLALIECRFLVVLTRKTWNLVSV